MKQAGISKLEKIELRTRLRKFIAEETDIRGLPDSVLFHDINTEYDCKLMNPNVFYPFNFSYI